MELSLEKYLLCLKVYCRCFNILSLLGVSFFYLVFYNIFDRLNLSCFTLLCICASIPGDVLCFLCAADANEYAN